MMAKDLNVFDKAYGLLINGKSTNGSKGKPSLHIILQQSAAGHFYRCEQRRCRCRRGRRARSLENLAPHHRI